jgi:predicted transcriptional regulator YheO
MPRHNPCRELWLLAGGFSPVLCIHREVTKESRVQPLYENSNNTIDEICKTLNVSRATLYRYIQTKEK